MPTVYVVRDKRNHATRSGDFTSRAGAEQFAEGSPHLEVIEETRLPATVQTSVLLNRLYLAARKMQEEVDAHWTFAELAKDHCGMDAAKLALDEALAPFDLLEA